MIISFKKLFFIVSFNLSLFFILFIGIQNSSIKNKVNFLFGETIELPVSFIIGTSFISGSILGSFVNFDSLIKKSSS